MPLFDKQEGHCLRISTQVVKWPERGDVQGVTDTVALDGVRAVEPGLTKTVSAISQESGLVRFVMGRANKNCPRYLLVVKCFVFQDFLGK